MNTPHATAHQLPDCAALLSERDVPRIGDFYRWADVDRCNADPIKRTQPTPWVKIAETDLLIWANLPVATLRVRHGQPELKFARTISNAAELLEALQFALLKWHHPNAVSAEQWEAWGKTASDIVARATA